MNPWWIVLGAYAYLVVLAAIFGPVVGGMVVSYREDRRREQWARERAVVQRGEGVVEGTVVERRTEARL